MVLSDEKADQWVFYHCFSWLHKQLWRIPSLTHVSPTAHVPAENSFTSVPTSYRGPVALSDRATASSPRQLSVSVVGPSMPSVDFLDSRLAALSLFQTRLASSPLFPIKFLWQKISPCRLHPAHLLPENTATQSGRVSLKLIITDLKWIPIGIPCLAYFSPL